MSERSDLAAEPAGSEPPASEPSAFGVLERNILVAKGMTEAQVATLPTLGITAKADFVTVGDVATLCALLPELPAEVASAVMQWATGSAGPGPGSSAGRTVLDTSDAVYCLHCQSKQPKDYSIGDLCPNCGKQAEPTESCYWCGSSGPGRFCRSCGAAFVGAAELDLAVALRRDGLAKDDIPRRLAAMSSEEKDALWGRVRRGRG